MLLSIHAVTGRPRTVRDGLPRDLAVEISPGLLTDRVTLGPYDLWVARRFRRDVRALTTPEPARG